MYKKIAIKKINFAFSVPDMPTFIWSHLPGELGKAGIEVKWVPAIEGHPGSYFYVQYRRKGNLHLNFQPLYFSYLHRNNFHCQSLVCKFLSSSNTSVKAIVM